MAFDKGKSKTGGRLRGTPNRRTQNLVELLNELNYSPVADLIEYSIMAKANVSASDDPLIKSSWVKIGVSCAAGLLPYVYPKRKPVETDLNQDQLEHTSTEELISLARQTIQELEQ